MSELMRSLRRRRRGPRSARAAGGPRSGRGSPVAVGARALRVGGHGWVAVLVVTGYPREVFPGWLAPVTNHGGLVDTTLHVEPIDPLSAATRLRRQLARLESGRRFGAEHGRLLDPGVEAATEDAYELADRVARGEGRLFALTLTLTVHAGSPGELAAEVAAVRALCASLLLEVYPATYRTFRGWLSSVPLGVNHLHAGPRGPLGAAVGAGGGGGGGGRVLDTAALSAAFPFTSPDLPDPPAPRHGDQSGAGSGVFYGHNLGSHGLLFWDRFGCDNYNSVVLGRSGSGKSYLVKLELLRWLYRGVDAQVIDPEDEYTRLADAVGGTIVRPGAAGVRINPFDLPIGQRRDGRRVAAADAWTRQVLFVHTFCAVALDATPDATQRAVLDIAITATYHQAGITADPGTWHHRAPLLGDLHAALDTLASHGTTVGPTTDAAGSGSADTDRDGHGSAGGDGHGAGVAGEAGLGAEQREVAAGLAARLRPFVEGAYAGLFDGPTSTPPVGHLVVWSLRELADELKPVATLLVLDAIWRQVAAPHDRRPRLITVDEAWTLLARPEGAQFLLRAAKSARKHWAGLTVATQDTADVLATDLGRAVVTNAATQILLRQAPQAIEQITATFALSAGERAFLLAAERGEGLLAAGTQRAAFTATASDFEDELITTDPHDLAGQHDPAPAWISLPPCADDADHTTADHADHAHADHAHAEYDDAEYADDADYDAAEYDGESGGGDGGVGWVSSAREVPPW